MAKRDSVAEEVSWFTTVFAVLAVLISSPAMVWAARFGRGPVAETARVAGTGLVVFAMAVYIIHLLSYNSVVRDGIEWLAELLGFRDRNPEVDWDE